MKIKHIGEMNEKDFTICHVVGKFYSPKFVKIKPTGKCNLRCPKCNYWRKKHNIEHPGLSKAKILELIDELAKMYCECIKFSGGEITLLPFLPQIIQYASEKGIKTSITSNGVLIDSKLAKKLEVAGLNKITVSLDSPVEKIHDEMVGLDGAAKKTMSALRCLAKTNIRLTAASVITSINHKSLNDMPGHLEKLGVKRWDLLALVINHLKDEGLALKDGSRKSFVKEQLPMIKATCDEKGVLLVNSDPFAEACVGNPAEFYKEHFCFVPTYSFGIHFDGRVIPCCSNKDDYYGNVHEKKLTNILNNVSAVEFRKTLLGKNVPENCKVCYDEMNRNADIEINLGLENGKN